jgi:HEAT repeat protein
MALVELLGDPHPFVRHESGVALARTAELYRGRPRLGVSIAARSSRTMSFDDLLGLMRASIAWPDAERRAATADALGRWRDAQVVPILTQALGDDHPFVRARAAAALGRIGDQEPIPALIAALNDRSLDVRCAAAGALGMIGDARAVGPLQQALVMAPAQAKTSILTALGHLPTAASRSALRDTLGDAVPEVRWAAVRALERAGDLRAISALEMLLADPAVVCGETLSASARRAIAAIERREVGLWNALRRIAHAVGLRLASVKARRSE